MRFDQIEPRALRTYTPTQAVIARSAGVYHWTADGRRLFDFTSGVLVSNLGHNPTSWMIRFSRYMGWPHPYPNRDGGPVGNDLRPARELWHGPAMPSPDQSPEPKHDDLQVGDRVA